MNAYAKKLLSWLCVAAMVFAMAPATMLPAFAEETEAAPEQTEEIVYGSANLPEGIQEIKDAAKTIQDADLAAHIEAGTCPICGEGVEWEEAKCPNQTKVEGEKRHYYVLDETVVSKGYNWYAGNAKNMTLCLALLNTTTAKEIGGLIGLRNQASGCTLNIMGSGTITSNGTSTSDGQFGTICVQGNNNTVNLYGGTFIYTGDGQGRTKAVTDNGDGTTTTTITPSGVIGAAAINLKGYDNTVNIFDGVTIGPEEQDLSKQCFNLLVQLTAQKKTNTVNMYGGTIQNGVSNLVNTSGNVHLHYDKDFTETGKYPTYPTFNMYGGTVSGGTYVESVSSNGGNFYAGPGAKLNIYGGTVTGGKAANGGNIYANSSSVCKISISGGIIENGEANNGGNIYSSAPVNLSGTALIRDGVATTLSGGNIYFASAKTHTISGGKIAGGTAAKNGGNIYMEAKKVTISGGIIEGGTAAAGGNLNVPATDLVVTGGTIQNGTATGAGGGGNIAGSGDKTITITGGIIQNGKAENESGGGGNLRVNCTAVNIGGDAQILGGEAGYIGGSIYITTKCVMTIDGNAIVSGGRSNSDGGNIAIYNGDLIIGGNAQIKDGRATRYTTKLNDKGATVDNHVSDGGNIYSYGYNETVDDVKVYSNELTIKDNAVISGGWAVRGGNIVADNTTVNIESGVLIKDGCAGIEVDGEMTYEREGYTDNVGRGGNIFHSTKECQVNIAATLSGGKARFAGNLGQFGGTINFSGIMENGNASNFGGNACIQNAILNMTGAELREAVSGGQGGNIRVYNGTVNMAGGKIYGGDDLSTNNTDNVWLVRSTLNMSGDATVQGNNAYGSALRAVAYDGIPSVVSLADTASVTGETKNVMTIQTNSDGDQSILYIAEGWAGTATAATKESYDYGQTIDENVMVVGTFAEDGTFVKGGTYTGTLTNNNVNVYGVEGNVVMAAAGYFVDDENKTWFQTNDEAIAAYQHSETAYVLLTGETAQIPETISEINIRLSGKDVTVSGKATVYGSDKGNDDYDGAAKLIPAEGAELTVMPTATMASGRRYIALQGEDGSWTFHRFVIALDTVTLRTEGNPGIYYKATYRCDETLAALVGGYGVALSLQDMPGADFETEDKFTAYGAESFQAAYKNNVVKTTSGAVVGIMKERNSKETNTANANRDIFANAYLKLNVGGEELVVMADSDTAYSLFEVLQGVNENWDSYSEEDKATIGAFLKKWSAFITDEAVALLKTQLDKIFPAA